MSDHPVAPDPGYLRMLRTDAQEEERIEALEHGPAGTPRGGRPTGSCSSVPETRSAEGRLTPALGSSSSPSGDGRPPDAIRPAVPVTVPHRRLALAQLLREEADVLEPDERLKALRLAWDIEARERFYGNGDAA